MTKQPGRGGLTGWLFKVLRVTNTRVTQAGFWRIRHTDGQESVSLKVGRYVKGSDKLECDERNRKSGLTLDHEETAALLTFLTENYEPFKEGVKHYIPLDPKKFDAKSVAQLHAFFNNPDKRKVLDLVLRHDILPQDLVDSIEHRSKLRALEEFERMIEEAHVEHDWQRWFKANSWILGSEFVRVLDERAIDTDTQADFPMQAYDGFLDVIEIKRPSSESEFWARTLYRGSLVPSGDLTRATAQASRYIFELELKANDAKFIRRVGVRALKPRCVLVFGRSHDWDEGKRQAYRILNSSYHNLTILTYDHVLERARRILGTAASRQEDSDGPEETDTDLDDTPSSRAS